MRPVLIYVLLSGVAVASWLLAGRHLVTLLDRFTLALSDHPAVDRLTCYGGDLELAGKHLDLSNPAFARIAEISLSSSGRTILESGGRRFPLGPGRMLDTKSLVPRFEFTKDTGDEVLLTVEQSRLAWPTPFEMNFMTGYAPSKKRNVYLRLRWTKLSGAKLEMLWKTGQSYYRRDGWLPSRIETILDGLIHLNIQESREFENAATEYLKRVKGWSPGDYHLENHGPSADLSGDVFFALHSQDKQSPVPGAGLSVELLVSYKDRRVVREIGGQ